MDNMITWEKKPHKWGWLIQLIGIILIIIGVIDMFNERVSWFYLVPVFGLIFYFLGMAMGSSVKKVTTKK